ncbi:hypothetical protein D3C87_1767570 [compost metagenome]
MVADNPDCKIELKTFHSEIINDHDSLRKEEESFKEIPPVRKIDEFMIQRNYLQIKQDVQDIIHSEIERLLNDPSQVYLVLKKEQK